MKVKIQSVKYFVWGSVGGSIRDFTRASVWHFVRKSVSDSIWDSVGGSVRHSVRNSFWEFYSQAYTE